MARFPAVIRTPFRLTCNPRWLTGPKGDIQHPPLLRYKSPTFYDIVGPSTPRDHFHYDKVSCVVCHRPDDSFGIFFLPSDAYSNNISLIAATSGVALTLCEYGGVGVELRDTPTHLWLLPEIQAKGRLDSEERLLMKLVITWPGYAHLRYTATIDLNTTFGDLADQVAQIFRAFYNEHQRNFKAPGFRLGIGNVSFDDIRLRSIYWEDEAWHIEASFVFNREPQWERN